MLKTQGRRSTKGLKIVGLLRRHDVDAELTGAMDRSSQLIGRTIVHGIFRITHLKAVPLEIKH